MGERRDGECSGGGNEELEVLSAAAGLINGFTDGLMFFQNHVCVFPSCCLRL